MRLFLIALFFAACTEGPYTSAGGDGSGPNDMHVYEYCASYCVRPSDCLIAYPSDELCPFGFACANKSSCAPDAGH